MSAAGGNATPTDGSHPGGVAMMSVLGADSLREIAAEALRRLTNVAQALDAYAAELPAAREAG